MHLLLLAVHPHLRGAYSIPTRRSWRPIGSSPPTWGILDRVSWKKTDNRFIPTYVGHTSKSRKNRSTVCGSSPPTWGIPAIPAGTTIEYRFIPTYVGHTAESQLNLSGRTVHPHLRGAYAMVRSLGTRSPGSSPPTWGIRGCRVLRLHISAVHPHLRGAYTPHEGQTKARGGSSPPTWGILSRMNPDQWKLRFIPTYVGHTLASSETSQLHSVHPHLRGAYR